MLESPLALELSALEAEALALGEHDAANALRGATMLARLCDERGLLTVGAIFAAGACVIPRSSILAQASQAILRRVSLASSAVAHAPAEELATSLADERALTRTLRAERGQLENELQGARVELRHLDQELSRVRRQLAIARGQAPGEFGQSLPTGGGEA